jgi:hypothetical protein
MRVLGPATEDDMVLVFLRAEIDSSRFAVDLLAALADLGLDRSLIDRADLSNAEGNLRRRQVLEEFRGPRRGPGAGVFWRLPRRRLLVVGCSHAAGTGGGPLHPLGLLARGLW